VSGLAGPCAGPPEGERYTECALQVSSTRADKEAKPQLLVPEPYQYRLLFVGVNTAFEGPPLRAAVRDAEAMSDRFRGWGYQDTERHRLLVRERATAANVLDHLQTTAREPDLDLLLVYWAGPMLARCRAHVLATACPPDDDGAATLNLESLTDAIAAANARHRVLILDTCATTEGTAPDPTAPHLNRLTRLASAHAAVAVLAISAPDALRREHHRRGYLTGALLEQLCPGAEPPRADFLGALRSAADRLETALGQHPVLWIAETAGPLHLPSMRDGDAPRARVLAMPSEHLRRSRMPATKIA
jgi:hypothetical protein